MPRRQMRIGEGTVEVGGSNMSQEAILIIPG